ncbi:hypothetical protein [Herpetosiphon llansteffanensis]|uniref:hypothetical protein n=1 Tax=Herpetosiphon llansteffanensis TaxID=2094568 RepID=UPI000D7C64C9|nr:hypothetical protein [Herpetosiphon llansteffanensis]
MEEHLFKLANYKTKFFVLLIAIILLGIWLFADFYAINFVIGGFILLIISQINSLTTRLLIDQDGLVIRRIFRQPIQIDWADLIGQQQVKLKDRMINYLVLRKPIPLVEPLQYADVPKEHRTTTFILDLWEQPQRVQELIEPHLPAKNLENQLFVPFTSTREAATTKLALIVMFVGFIVTTVTILLLL